jgi:hypothetical protein
MAQKTPQTGYIMNIEGKKITVRREIQAPEVDEYDEITEKQIQSGEELDIGARITYSL